MQSSDVTMYKLFFAVTLQITIGNNYYKCKIMKICNFIFKIILAFNKKMYF